MSSSIPHQLPLFPERVCSKCGKTRPLDDFYVHHKTTGRRYSWCKDCHNERTRANYEANKERHNAQSVAWQKAHWDKVLEGAAQYRSTHREQINERARLRNATPEAKEKRRSYKAANAEKIKAQNAEYRRRKKAEIDAYNAAYRDTHREQMAQAARRSREKKPEHYNALSRAWKAAHPQERISHTHKRRALLRGMGGVVTAFEWERIKAQHEWRCVDCGRQEKTEGITLCRDHIIPLRPGFNIAANIAPRCKQCNSKKHRRLLRRREG